MAVQYIDGGSQKRNNHGVVRGNMTSPLLGGVPAKDVRYSAPDKPNHTVLTLSNPNGVQVNLGSTTPKRNGGFISYETSPSGNYIGSSGVYEGKTTNRDVFSSSQANHIVFQIGKPKTF